MRRLKKRLRAMSKRLKGSELGYRGAGVPDLPACCGSREFVMASGLMSHGDDLTEAYHQARAGWSFRNASIDCGEVTLWVSFD